MLDDFIDFKRKERVWNNVVICFIAGFITWACTWLIHDPDKFEKGLDLLIMVWWGWMLYKRLRTDRQIVQSIEQAKLQKTEWEGKRKAFGE